MVQHSTPLLPVPHRLKVPPVVEQVVECLINLKNLFLPSNTLSCEHNIVGVKASYLQFFRKRILQKLTTLTCSGEEKIMNMNTKNTDDLVTFCVWTGNRIKEIVCDTIQHICSVHATAQYVCSPLRLCLQPLARWSTVRLVRLFLTKVS